jgi:glycosyltransferase involved in cell wall biosynthesis
MMSVSIIIPTYNSACFVTQAVDSALAQTQSSCEVIVVDDGSIDDTANLLASYRSKVQYLHQDNAGPQVAKPRLAAAQGFVGFLTATMCCCRGR